MKDLKTLLIELDQVNRRLDRIKNDPEYIEQKAKEVFGDKPKRDYSSELNAIMDQFL